MWLLFVFALFMLSTAVACNDGWFGDDCDKQCSKEVCEKITGHCSSGCTAGFTGGNSQTLCSDGWFGENCDKQCHCLDNKKERDKITGHCGCTPGFNDCQTSGATNTSFLTTVAITCGVVMSIIVLVACLCIRRLQMKIKALETPHEEPYASLDPETMEQMSETCYSEIADGRYDAI
ncbi:multiple epidermal growth factor-like domains protein 10 [Haliotis asinina]|uniref:multiple epidermal growth factor-like domains protein 10 n=1 Tax=Haliotis asinina TaxID=109174 RepID=UPI0035327C6B